MNWLRETLTFIEREYLSSWVHNLSNSLKTSDTTKIEFFELKFFQIDKKIWQNYCREDFSSVSEHLTCWLSISVLSQGFLGIYITTLFAGHNFGNKLAMRVIFVFKTFKIWCTFQKFGKTWQIFFGFGDNRIWIGCVKDWLLTRENTCHRECISCETVSRFQILLRKNFLNWSSFRLIKKIWQNYCREDCSGVLDANMLTLDKCSEGAHFSHLSKNAFCSL